MNNLLEKNGKFGGNNAGTNIRLAAKNPFENRLMGSGKGEWPGSSRSVGAISPYNRGGNAVSPSKAASLQKDAAKFFKARVKIAKRALNSLPASTKNQLLHVKRLVERAEAFTPHKKTEVAVGFDSDFSHKCMREDASRAKTELKKINRKLYRDNYDMPKKLAILGKLGILEKLVKDLNPKVLNGEKIIPQ